MAKQRGWYNMCPTRFKAFLTLISDHAHSRWRGDKLPRNSMENLFPGTLLWSLVFIRNDFPVVFLQIACEQILERLKPYQMENPKGSWEEWVSTLFFFKKLWTAFLLKRLGRFFGRSKVPKLLPFGKDSIGPVENFCDWAEGRVVHCLRGYSRRVTKEPRSLEKRKVVVSLSISLSTGMSVRRTVGPSNSRPSGSRSVRQSVSQLIGPSLVRSCRKSFILNLCLFFCHVFINFCLIAFPIRSALPTSIASIFLLMDFTSKKVQPLFLSRLKAVQFLCCN